MTITSASPLATRLRAGALTVGGAVLATALLWTAAVAAVLIPVFSRRKT